MDSETILTILYAGRPELPKVLHDYRQSKKAIQEDAANLARLEAEDVAAMWEREKEFRRNQRQHQNTQGGN